MRKAVAALAFFVILAFLLMAATEMRNFGDPAHEKMDNYFLENSQVDDETNNVVAAVLFDYRGIDTLGEATILFSAVSGVIAVLRNMKKVERGVSS
uniref:Membrane-bound hydrogenase MBH 2, subunit Mbh2E (Na+/H+ transporter subunit) n=1 Tax=uncultured organism TaxID=155900 RepID=M1QAL1_9ZZZZ|nr:membrane-bound hydrogenase MBH 2, subunit Mbh2E (Na+/H+ transporter subunit) [uncultured organism]